MCLPCAGGENQPTWPYHLQQDDCELQAAPAFPLILSLSKDVRPSNAWFDKSASGGRFKQDFAIVPVSMHVTVQN